MGGCECRRKEGEGERELSAGLLEAGGPHPVPVSLRTGQADWVRGGDQAGAETMV